MNTSQVGAEFAQLEQRDLSAFQFNLPSKRNVEDWIARLDVSADAKLWLQKILDTTVRIGDRILKIGAKIAEAIMSFIKTYPTMSVGVAVALIVTTLVSGIPIIGALLGAVVGPLLAALGLTLGFVNDLRNQAAERQLAAAMVEFEDLKT